MHLSMQPSGWMVCVCATFLRANPLARLSLKLACGSEIHIHARLKTQDSIWVLHGQIPDAHVHMACLLAGRQLATWS
jgi:hypothetical protein